jgi:hypothetical protein
MILVIFISIHFFIICDVFFGAHMRRTRLYPLNPGVTHRVYNRGGTVPLQDPLCCIWIFEGGTISVHESLFGLKDRSDHRSELSRRGTISPHKPLYRFAADHIV